MYPGNTSKAADMVCVLFIFIYAFGYSLGFGPAAWLYGSEVGSLIETVSTSDPVFPGVFVSTRDGRKKGRRTAKKKKKKNSNEDLQIFPTSVRARGLNFSASAGSIGSIIVAQIWPIGIHAFGSNIYFFFLAVNVLCIPVRLSTFSTPSFVTIRFLGWSAAVILSCGQNRVKVSMAFFFLFSTSFSVLTLCVHVLPCRF